MDLLGTGKAIFGGETLNANIARAGNEIVIHWTGKDQLTHLAAGKIVGDRFSLKMSPNTSEATEKLDTWEGAVVSGGKNALVLEGKSSGQGAPIKIEFGAAMQVAPGYSVIVWSSEKPGEPPTDEMPVGYVYVGAEVLLVQGDAMRVVRAAQFNETLHGACDVGRKIARGEREFPTLEAIERAVTTRDRGEKLLFVDAFQSGCERAMIRHIVVSVGENSKGQKTLHVSSCNDREPLELGPDVTSVLDP